MTLDRDVRLRETRSAAPAPGAIRITLAHSDQALHLLDALRGHCEAELVWTSDGATTVVVAGDGSGNRNVLRRVDAWLTEFGVASAALELDGRTYQLTRT